MEACLEFYESNRRNVRGAFVGLLCIVILCVSIFRCNDIKSKEYLSAKQQTKVENEIKVNSINNVETEDVLLEVDLADVSPVLIETGNRVQETGTKIEAIANMGDKLGEVQKDYILNEDVALKETGKTGVEDMKKVVVEDTKNVTTDEPKEIVGEDSNTTNPDEMKEMQKVEEDLNEDESGITEAASPFLIDEEGMLYGVRMEELDYTSGVLELPTENCVGIRSNAFIGGISGIYEIYIPANISMIETGALNGLADLFDITVEAGNVNYSSIDGVLYGEQGTTLLAFPAGRTGGYIVPSQTQRIESGAFYQTGLSVIDIRDCGELEIVDEQAMQLVRN